jgi:hypothetical protein
MPKERARGMLVMAGGLLLVARFLSGDGTAGTVVGWTGFTFLALALFFWAGAQRKADSSVDQSNSSVSQSNSSPGQVVTPSGVTVGRTCLELGDRVLVYARERWWRAQVAGIDDGDLVRVVFTNYDPASQYCVHRRFLQLDVPDTALAGCQPVAPSGLAVGSDTYLHGNRSSHFRAQEWRSCGGYGFVAWRDGPVGVPWMQAAG